VALTFEEKKDSAYCVGVHLCIIRHWTGANALISQGGLFVTTFSPGIGHYTSLLINLFQGTFIVIGLVWIQTLVGKRPLFLFSIALLSATNLALVIAMIYKNVLVIVFLMCFYMAVYGGSFSSPIWAYPSEVIPARKSLVSNIVHWLALAISTLVPPIIGGMMPDNNPYPVFLFFAFYGIGSFFHIFRYLRESDGKSFADIIKSYK
jgi:MFS family permease